MTRIAAGAIRGSLCGLLVLSVGIASGASTAWAQEATPATCAAAGKDYSIGEVACIPACHGQQRLAKCEQTGGGVSWTSVSDTCPNALNLFTPGQGVQTAMGINGTLISPDRRLFLR